MKILVLGARGFIGKHLCTALVTANYEVYGFDLPPINGCWPDIAGVNWIAGQFENQADIISALDGIDLVFHMISTSIPKTSNENPLIDLQQNVSNTLKLLDIIIAQPKMPSIIFLSSGGTVYGIPFTIPIPEGHSTDPLSAYGIAKLTIEKYLALYGYLHGLDYRILRLANPYGEYQSFTSGQGIIAAIIHKALNHESLHIWGDGSVIRDYIYIGDVVSAMIAMIEYNGPEKLFNIGSGKGYSILDLLQTVRDLLQRDITCQYFPSRICDVPINVLDINRAVSVLRWNPTISLKEGMGRVIDFQIRENA
ncbi:MAG: NAD-dependent epimerase/dehydratase family protein [Nitrosomonas sp.]|nr:NAD-dependent epimerase/dehydratase family protein [Nitrosomonas sp.]MBK7365969.1 NAD-dependent epimerase/dehydratase family protein [Nitrosomonas sp.]